LASPGGVDKLAAHRPMFIPFSTAIHRRFHMGCGFDSRSPSFLIMHGAGTCDGCLLRCQRGGLITYCKIRWGSQGQVCTCLALSAPQWKKVWHMRCLCRRGKSRGASLCGKRGGGEGGMFKYKNFQGTTHLTRTRKQYVETGQNNTNLAPTWAARGPDK
jgi:hypothetical protein